jgi:hypothetical protein
MGNGARRMLGWAVGDSLVRGARARPARASGVPVMGRVLVELVLGDGLGSLEIDDRGLVEVELGLGRAAYGGHPGRSHVSWDAVGHGPSDGDHGGPQARVGGEDPVVAVAVDAWGWYEKSQSLKEREGSEAKLEATVHIGLGAVEGRGVTAPSKGVPRGLHVPPLDLLLPSGRCGPPFTSSGEAHTSMDSPLHGHQTLPKAREDVGLDGVSHA